MSFASQPTMSLPAKLGCFAVGLVLVGLSMLFLTGAAMGHCAPEADGSGCEYDGLIKFMMFPVFPIASVIFMVWFVRRLMRGDA